MNDDFSSFGALLQRGIMLCEQGRHKDAVQFLGQAIELEPESATAYLYLATAYNELPGHRKQAIGAIDRAIQLDPGNATLHGAKGWIQVCQGHYPGALKSANEAIALDPGSIAALNALTNAHTKLGNWKDAEAAARRILAIYPHDIAALNLLAQALRLQGRAKESRAIVATILSGQPDDSFAHTNAGYGALQAGDHLRANEHFLQALRLEPNSDFARRGLLMSLRSRVWIFRHLYRFGTIARQPLTWSRALIFTVIVFGLGIGFVALEAASPEVSSVVLVLVLLYFYLCLFSHVLGDIFLLFDPLGKHALAQADRWRSWFIFGVLGLVVYAFIQAEFWMGLAFIGGSLLVFGVSIHYARLKDRWEQWRSGHAEE